MKIKDSVILVTGACGGLGRAIVDMLAKEGAKTIAADCNYDALEALPAPLIKKQMDVTNEVNVKNVITEIGDQYGCIDILVNCAGKIVSCPFVNILNPSAMMMRYEEFRKDLLINLDSVFIVSAAVVEQMVLKRKRGCIINISSISARGNEGQTSYSAAKAGVEALTITWAKELGRLGIRVNAVAPGFIDTPSTHAALQPAQIKHIISNTPLRRLGTANEVAEAVLSLAKNDFLNGVILDVNGGLSI